MGTLQSQPARNYRHMGMTEVMSEIKDIQSVAKNANVTFDQALRVFELLELRRRNSLFVDNGNIWDEQIAGIGQILDRMVSDNLPNEPF